MTQPGIEARQAAARRKPQLSKPLSTIQRYGLAVLCVSAATGGGLLLQWFKLRDVELPIMVFAVALASWYGGARAGVLALVLASLSVDYFFAEPVILVRVLWRHPLFYCFRFIRDASHLV